MVRFRLGKEAVLLILDNIDRNLDDGIMHNSSISPLNQLPITLRYYATGMFFSVNGDLFGLHKCTLLRIIKNVPRAIPSFYSA